MLRNTIMALRCRAASPLEWEVSFLLVQADRGEWFRCFLMRCRPAAA
jgi:hypothetical protein